MPAYHIDNSSIYSGPPPDLTLNPFMSPTSPNSPLDLDLADTLTPTVSQAQSQHLPTPPPDPSSLSAADWDFFGTSVPLPPSSSSSRSEIDLLTPSDDNPSSPFAASAFDEGDSDEEGEEVRPVVNPERPHFFPCKPATSDKLLSRWQCWKTSTSLSSFQISRGLLRLWASSPGEGEPEVYRLL
ncbi:hypothetical protein DENSPDRAFT_839350, partial [Dentipellis sp. KUC8613]